MLNYSWRLSLTKENCSCDEVLVTSHLNNNIIKWNLTPDNIKSQVAEYKITPYSYPRYLKGNTEAHYNAYNPKRVRDSQYSK